MKQQRTGRRYYKVGEKIWITESKQEGVITELNINPKKNLYKVKVQTKVGKNNAVVDLVLDVWEIDKHKQEMYKAKRKSSKPTILFAKVRPSAIIPSKDEENAGYDIYADFEEDYLTIPPQGVKMIPTGIASSVTEDFALIAKERGSTGTKAMAVRSGVVDSGYRGEIFIVINNTGDRPVIIAKDVEKYENHSDAIVYPYTKAIAQLMLVNVPKARVKEISYDELKNIPSKRGEGKLGDSGK